MSGTTGTLKHGGSEVRGCRGGQRRRAIFTFHFITLFDILHGKQVLLS